MLEPEERRKFDELLALSRENNSMLKKMVNHMRWATFFRVIYWLIIIAISVGAYYILEPYLAAATDAFKSLGENAEAISKLFKSIPR